jgi:hypothetical protein
VLHTYGVALRRKEKRENGQSWRKRSEARESPQTVEEKPEGLGLGPLQESLRWAHSSPDGGGWLAELLRSLIRRSSANRGSAKFALMEFSEVRVRQVSYSRLYEP